MDSSWNPWEYLWTTDRENFRHRPEYLPILVRKWKDQKDPKKTIRRSDGRINRRWKRRIELRFTWKKYGVILLCIDKIIIYVLVFNHSYPSRARYFWLSWFKSIFIKSLKPILCIPPPKIIIYVFDSVFLISADELSLAFGIFLQY